jgi:hypothetical protein
MPSPWIDAKLAVIHAGHPSGFSSARPPLQRGGKVKGSARRAQRLGDRLRDHHRLCVLLSMLLLMLLLKLRPQSQLLPLPLQSPAPAFWL